MPESFGEGGMHHRCTGTFIPSKAEDAEDQEEEEGVIVVDGCQSMSLEVEKQLLMSRLLALQSRNHELETRLVQTQAIGAHPTVERQSRSCGGHCPEWQCHSSTPPGHCFEVAHRREVCSQTHRSLSDELEDPTRREDNCNEHMAHWKRQCEANGVENATDEVRPDEELTFRRFQHSEQEVARLRHLLEVKEQEKQKQFLTAVETRTKLLETEKERSQLSCEVMYTKAMLYEMQQSFTQTWPKKVALSSSTPPSRSSESRLSSDTQRHSEATTVSSDGAYTPLPSSISSDSNNSYVATGPERQTRLLHTPLVPPPMPVWPSSQAEVNCGDLTAERAMGFPKEHLRVTPYEEEEDGAPPIAVDMLKPLEGAMKSFRYREYHPAVLLEENQLWTGQEEWTNLFQRFHRRYQALWDASRRIARSSCLLLYAIPAYRRDGVKNIQWKRSEFVYYCKPNRCWKSIDMQHLMIDPINGDSVFRVAIPREHSPAYCFVRDKDSLDSDHPGGVFGERERRLELKGNYYYLKSSFLNSLRDGEVAEGDRISNLGISIRFQNSGTIKHTDYWDGAVLHYLNESDGRWSERAFNQGGESTVYLLESKSVTFVIRDRSGKRWLKSPSGMDFRISFPGAYVLYSDGQLFECSIPGLSIGNDAPEVPNNSPASPAHSYSSEAIGSTRPLPAPPQVFRINTPPNGPRRTCPADTQ